MTLPHDNNENNYLFIVNPKSGKGQKKKELPLLVEKVFRAKRLPYKLIYTEAAGHAVELVNEHCKQYKNIIAAGGDGTVNEVSAALLFKENNFGIIPMGSGNGLARALKIPMNLKKAIERVVSCITQKIDTGEINGQHFINVSGIGFDAEIAHRFAEAGKRGFQTYFEQVLKRFIKYKPKEIKITYDDGKVLITSPFLLSIANSSQWGNNVHISPLSSLNDGLLDICVLKKFPLTASPILAGRLFLKSVHLSPFMSVTKVSNLKIEFEGEILGHLDGEPVIFNNEMNIKVLQNSINVIK